MSRNLNIDFNNASSNYLEELYPPNEIIPPSEIRPPAELRPRPLNTTPPINLLLLIPNPNAVTIVEIVSKNQTEIIQINNAIFDIFIKNILKQQLDYICIDVCAICLDTPKLNDALFTSCNHSFCKKCYVTWINNNNNNYPSCPNCRIICPSVCLFKHRLQKIFLLT